MRATTIPLDSWLSKGRRRFTEIACPILRQHAASDEKMERGMRPVANSRNQIMFYRIIVNVIHVSGKIFLIADRVFPVAPLPNGKLPVRAASDRETCREQP